MALRKVLNSDRNEIKKSMLTTGRQNAESFHSFSYLRMIFSLLSVMKMKVILATDILTWFYFIRFLSWVLFVNPRLVYQQAPKSFFMLTWSTKWQETKFFTRSVRIDKIEKSGSTFSAITQIQLFPANIHCIKLT